MTVKADAATMELVTVLHAVADPTRLALLRLVMHAEHSVSDCVEQTGRGQGAVSRHLAALAAAGLVTSRREGRFTYYRVSDPSAVQALLASAEQLQQSAALARA